MGRLPSATHITEIKVIQGILFVPPHTDASRTEPMELPLCDNDYKAAGFITIRLTPPDVRSDDEIPAMVGVLDTRDHLDAAIRKLAARFTNTLDDLVNLERDDLDAMMAMAISLRSYVDYYVTAVYNIEESRRMEEESKRMEEESKEESSRR